MKNDDSAFIAEHLTGFACESLREHFKHDNFQLYVANQYICIYCVSSLFAFMYESQGLSFEFGYDCKFVT